MAIPPLDSLHMTRISPFTPGALLSFRTPSLFSTGPSRAPKFTPFPPTNHSTLSPPPPPQMALRISIPSASIRPSSPRCSAPGRPAAERWLGGGGRSAGGIRVRFQEGRGDRVVLARSSMETAVTVGQVTEVDKDTFWPIVEAAAPKVVVLDMYTQWCGPCKVMAPKYQELSEKYLDVVFLKLDCNQDNRPLAKDLGIRVVPTFKILKEGKVVKEVTGAKYDDLVLAIEAARTS